MSFQLLDDSIDKAFKLLALTFKKIKYKVIVLLFFKDIL